MDFGVTRMSTVGCGPQKVNIQKKLQINRFKALKKLMAMKHVIITGTRD